MNFLRIFSFMVGILPESGKENSYNPLTRLCLTLAGLCFLFLLAGCSSHYNRTRTTIPPCSAGNINTASPNFQTITFVHVNDLHANYNPDPNAGNISPFSRIRGYCKAVKQENPYTLCTDGGDDFERGSIAEILSEGKATVEVTRAMRFDARVIGNHDFAWGEGAVLEHSRDPHAIVLASNTKYTGPHPEDFGAVDYAKFQVGKLQIGFFGMLGKPWDEKNEEYDGKYFPGGNFHTRSYDYEWSAQKIIDANRNNLDLLIMVSHLGLYLDKEVASEVNGIDVILGGHSHDKLTAPVEVEDTLIIQAGWDAGWVARLDLAVDLITRKVACYKYELHANVPPNKNLPVDAEFQQAVTNVMQKYAPNALKKITILRDQYSKTGIAELTARAAKSVLQSDAGLVDQSTVWGEWGAWHLTPQDMLNTFRIERQPPNTPGFSSFYLVDIQGKDLLRVKNNMPATWSYQGIEDVVPDKTYVLALQKHAAYNPDVYLPKSVKIKGRRFGLEAWDVIYRYGSSRTGKCLYLDSDEMIPDCTPRLEPYKKER